MNKSKNSEFFTPQKSFQASRPTYKLKQKDKGLNLSCKISNQWHCKPLHAINIIQVHSQKKKDTQLLQFQKIDQQESEKRDILIATIREKKQKIFDLQRINEQLLRNYNVNSPQILTSGNINQFLYYEKLNQTTLKWQNLLANKNQVLQMKYKKLNQELTSLQQQGLPSIDDEKLHKKYQKLKKKLDIDIKSSSSLAEKLSVQLKQLKMGLQEKENLILSLRSELIKLKQRRLLVKVEEFTKNQKSLKRNCKDWRLSLDFIAKPSLNRLYSQFLSRKVSIENRI